MPPHFAQSEDKMLMLQKMLSQQRNVQDPEFLDDM